MTDWSGESRDLAGLVVPLVGAVVETEDPWERYRVVDAAGALVVPAAEYLRDLQAAGRPETTQRSYSLALLRWFRFLWAAGVPWGQATRAEARDFCRWMQIADKPARVHWRHQGADTEPGVPVSPGPLPGTANAVTGKRSPGTRYAPTTRVHSETVLRSFYDFHRDAGSGPMVNPFPLARDRRGGRAHAHHNPMEPYRAERSGAVCIVPPSRPARPGGFPMSGWTSCSRGFPRTVTGPWSRSTSRPVSGPRNCSVPESRTPTRGSS